MLQTNLTIRAPVATFRDLPSSPEKRQGLLFKPSYDTALYLEYKANKDASAVTRYHREKPVSNLCRPQRCFYVVMDEPSSRMTVSNRAKPADLCVLWYTLCRNCSCFCRKALAWLRRGSVPIVTNIDVREDFHVFM